MNSIFDKRHSFEAFLAGILGAILIFLFVPNAVRADHVYSCKTNDYLSDVCTAFVSESSFFCTNSPILSCTDDPFNGSFIDVCTNCEDFGQVCDHSNPAGCISPPTPTPTPTLAPLPPILSVTPSSINFGSITVGTSTTGSFTVSNSGGGELNGTVSISAGSPIFSASGGFTLFAGESTSFTVTFSPTAITSYTGTFHVAAGAITSDRPLSGSGVSGAICSETDVDNLPTVFGNCNDSFGSKPDACSGTNVTQFKCSGTSCISAGTTDCASFGLICVGGACAPAPPTPTPTTAPSCSSFTNCTDCVLGGPTCGWAAAPSASGLFCESGTSACDGRTNWYFFNCFTNQCAAPPTPTPTPTPNPGDTTPPIVSVDREPSGSVTTTNSVLFTISASDSSGVQDGLTKIHLDEIGNDDINDFTHTCPAGTGCSITRGPYAPAGRTIKYWGQATDNANIVGSSAIGSFTVTGVAPTPTPTPTLPPGVTPTLGPTATPTPTLPPGVTPTLGPTATPTPTPTPTCLPIGESVCGGSGPTCCLPGGCFLGVCYHDPTANFKIDKVEGMVVTITDQSIAPTTPIKRWVWNFNKDGTADVEYNTTSLPPPSPFTFKFDYSVFGPVCGSKTYTAELYVESASGNHRVDKPVTVSKKSTDLKGKLQCSVVDDGSCKCTAIDTAIGPISVQGASFVTRIMSLLLGISGGIAVLIIILAGYQLMTSRDKPEAIQESRQKLMGAIAGLLFIALALVVLQVIGVNILQIPGFEP